MYIAICDDDSQALHQIAEAIGEYAAACGLKLRMQTFEDAKSLLQAARAERFTHYFLDVMMPDMDGLSAAREIRSFDEDARLVFLSSFTEYAYQSYRVRATDYLLKPVQPKMLTELLDRLWAQEKRAEECICLENGRGVLRIPYDRLCFVEVNQKKLHFHLAGGQLREIPGTFASFEAELLSRPGFVKIHRSYIVNLSWVSELSPEGCILFSGINLPVSRLLYQQVRRAYMAYLFGQEG